MFSLKNLARKGLRFESLPAQISSLTTFKHEKEGKLASPANFLPAEGLQPELMQRLHDIIWIFNLFQTAQ